MSTKVTEWVVVDLANGEVVASRGSWEAADLGRRTIAQEAGKPSWDYRVRPADKGERA